MLAGTVRATIDGVRTLHAMPDDAAATMSAGGRQLMDGALEAVEYVCLATHVHLKTFVVRITAYFTSGHAVAEGIFICLHIYLISKIAFGELPGLS